MNTEQGGSNMAHDGRLNIINRAQYETFQNSPIIPCRMDRRISSTSIRRVSHDEIYKKLKKRGLQIDITNPEILVNGRRPLDGIFSPLFGADTTQELPIYSCDCRKLTGGVNLGRICPDCGTRCRSIEADLTTCGYIDIAPYRVLTYHGYHAFTKLFGNDTINDIITSVKKINVRGKIIDDGKETLTSLYEHYDEKYFKHIGIAKKYLFTSKIPVYSARLRPLMFNRGNFKMTILDSNKCYLAILHDRNNLLAAPVLNLERGTEVQRTLNDIQQNMVKLYQIIEGLINEKGGALRKSLAAARVDYSARLVISLNITLQPHEVDIPYSTMMTLFQEEIANYLSKLEGISVKQAIDLTEHYTFIWDERFVKIINQLLKSKHGKWALLNRNPTISESSILYVRIRKIHKDPEDYTLHLAPDILGLLAADFDYGIFVEESHGPALQECGCCAA